MKRTFDYCGKKFTMSDEEIDAAYRYRKHEYLLADAKSQFQYHFDGNISRLKDEFNTSYEEAISESMLEEYADRFEDRHDCDIDENFQWETAIDAVLLDHKEGLL